MEYQYDRLTGRTNPPCCRYFTEGSNPETLVEEADQGPNVIMTSKDNGKTREVPYLMAHHLVGAKLDGNFQFFLTDALGTVRDIVDDTGDVIQSYEFNEHGIPMPGSGAGSGTFSPKTYQGALSVNDDRADSGLYLMGHRHYAADLGRFISRDPIGFAGGLNLFNGASTSPVTMVDPSGLQPPSAYDGLPPGYSVPGMPGAPIPFSSEGNRRIDQAIGNIRNLGYGKEADRLQLLKDNGLLNKVRDSLNAGARNNPLSGGIDLRESACFGGSKNYNVDQYDRTQSMVYLTALLYHEARHHLTQSNGFKAATVGPAQVSNEAWLGLEGQAYLDESAFLESWANSPQPWSKYVKDVALELSKRRRNKYDLHCK